ncbi:MAG: DUF4358 domain-containing protein [Oscillospiraceae bacterium]|nr:DUF4358 domain-containing protein [Oscillospiraceae bacterium]
MNNTKKSDNGKTLEEIRKAREKREKQKLLDQKKQQIRTAKKKEKQRERKESREIHTADDVFAAAVIIILLGAALVNMLHRSRSMSEKENRQLAMFPEMSIKTIFDGSFMSDFETYAADQFAWRDGAVTLKAECEKLMRKSENNGVYFAKDNYLISKPEKFNKQQVDKNIEAIKTLQEVGGYNMTVAVIPTAYEILHDKLPAYAYDNRVLDVQNEVAKQFDGTEIKVCDPTLILSDHKDEYIYYRTDHHQTMLGSYYVYSALGEYLDYSAPALENYNRETLANDFYGTTWSKASIKSASPDTIERFTLKDHVLNASVQFPFEDQTMIGLYNKRNLEKKDKYTVYIDGNHGLTVINTTSKTGKKLAVLKDSYAHSLAPFLADQYEVIYMVDLRYYNEDLVKYLKDNKVKDMLVLYNAETFNTDISLGTVGEMALSTMALIGPPYGLLDEQEPVDDSYFTDAVFFGDSITLAHSMNSSLPAQFVAQTSLNTMTMNSSGSADQLLGKTDITKYYLMIGINEIHYTAVDDYIRRYGELIDKLKEEHPDTVIYIESLLPIEERVEGNPVRKASIDEANERLLELAKDKECYYLDINSYIAEDDGYLEDGTATDGIHFYGATHEKWDEYLKTHAVEINDNGKSVKEFNLYAGGGKIDTEKFAKEIIDTVGFKDTLSKTPDNVTARLTGIGEGEALCGTLYIGGGSTAEEFAIFEAGTAEKAKAIAEKLKKHVENRKASFETYKPAEMSKLNNPVIEVRGNVVMLCVSDNNSKAKEVMKKY